MTTIAKDKPVRPRDGRPMKAKLRHAAEDWSRIRKLVAADVSVTDACAVVGRSREFYYAGLRDRA